MSTAFGSRGVANAPPPTPSTKLLHHWPCIIGTDDVLVPQSTLGAPELALQGLPATGLGATPGWLTFNHVTPGTDTQAVVSVAGIDNFVETDWHLWSLWVRSYETATGKRLLANTNNPGTGISITTRVAGTRLRCAFELPVVKEYEAVLNNTPATPPAFHVAVVLDGATHNLRTYSNGIAVANTTAAGLVSATEDSIFRLGGAFASYCNCQIRDVHIYGGHGAAPLNIGQIVGWLSSRVYEPLPASILP